MNVKEIVKKWLEDEGYDGLYGPDSSYGCACKLGEFMPCIDTSWDFEFHRCMPGYLGPCDCGGKCDWHICSAKPEAVK